MKNNTVAALALGAALIAVPAFISPVASQETGGLSCAETPDAVTTLPAPLDRWAQVVCTKAGYVITSRDGWLWIEPTHNAMVIIPSQAFGRHAQTMDGGSAYFTKIELTKVKGEEFDKAYETFHAGFDPKDAKPSAYRLDITTMAGNDLRLYLFDYFTYGWGMACSKDACDRSSRFVMLNMNEDPKPLPHPI